LGWSTNGAFGFRFLALSAPGESVAGFPSEGHASGRGGLINVIVRPPASPASFSGCQAGLMALVRRWRFAHAVDMPAFSP
jgi:hypothetical protein